MDKKTGHILSAVMAAAVVVVLFRQNAALQDKVDQLSQQMSSLSNQLVDTRYELSDQVGTLRREMEAEASLFSDVETELRYVGGDLTLTVTVVPKELSAGETAQVALSTGETADLTDDGTGRLSGVLTCSLRDSLEPVVSLTAGDRTRREILPTLWTSELFTLAGVSHWLPETDSYDELQLVFTTPAGSPLDHSALEVEAVTVEVRVSFLDPTGEGSRVGAVEAVPQADGSWLADLSPYMDNKEAYDYDFWVSAATREGLTLDSDQPVADCRQSEGGTSSSRSEGDFNLSADFGEG